MGPGYEWMVHKFQFQCGAQVTTSDEDLQVDPDEEISVFPKHWLPRHLGGQTRVAPGSTSHSHRLDVDRIIDT